MGFAAGFAAGYEAVDKGRREEEARQKAIEEQKLKLQQIDQSAMQQAGTLSINTMKELKSSNDSINKAQNLTEYNSAIDMYNNVGTNFMNIAQANIESTPTQGVKNIYGSVQFQPKEKATQLSIPDVNGNIKEVVLPESFADQKDSLILMQNGNVGIRNIGEDGKFSNIQPTNVKPIEFKPSKDMFTNGLSLYTPKGDEVKAYSQEEADSFMKQGFGRVKPKEDKGTNVSVKIDQQVAGNEKLYNELISLDENGDINNKKDTNRMKAVSGQLLSNATTEDKKAVGDTKQLIATIPALQRLATTQDELAKKLNAIGGDTIVRKAVTNMAPYIGSNNKLMELAGMDEATIAKTLQLDTSSAKVIGDYAKAMSGLSLTDSQLQYYKNIVVGGDWMDYKTRALKTNQFISDEKKNIESRLKTYGDYMLPEKKQWEKDYGTKQDSSNIIKAPYGNEVTRNGKNYIWDSSINKYILKP